MTDDGLLYFIQAANDGPIKAGYTGDANMRLRTLQAWCPYDLTALLAIRVPQLAEHYVHQTLRAHRIRGEWYHPHPFVKNFIESVRAARAVPGLPEPMPDLDRCKQVIRINFAGLIPSVWGSREDFARAVGVKAFPPAYWHFSPALLCRIIMAARKVGVNLATSDAVMAGPSGQRSYRQYKPREPGKSRQRREPFHNDILIETCGVPTPKPDSEAAA